MEQPTSLGQTYEEKKFFGEVGEATKLSMALEDATLEETEALLRQHFPNLGLDATEIKAKPRTERQTYLEQLFAQKRAASKDKRAAA